MLRNEYRETRKNKTLPYVCNELIFDGLQFTLKKIFLKNPLITFVAHLIALLSVSFVFKLVNYSSGTKDMKIRESSCLASILIQKLQNISFD